MFTALGVSVATMAALHLVQPELDPIAQPVSFYIHGAHGWLLTIALAAFATALIVLPRACDDDLLAPRNRILLTLAGAVLLLTALIPSDHWFPWEQPPTLSGLAHGAAALIAPMALLVPVVSATPARDARFHAALPWIVGLYTGSVIGSAVSLAIGFLHDTSPPWIGLVERLLAFAAVSWVGVIAWRARPDASEAPL